ncbi:MAG: SpoVR family protein, partial [Gemmatimonadetes bacterium]|nr:SpoVR family protein [Gemmatimonadota bacterium]
MSLPGDLQKIKDEVEAVAQSVGLDFFETIFEMVDYDMMNEIASYGGFPSRYPHWRFGMSYES